MFSVQSLAVRASVPLLAAVVLLAAVPTAANAQYFGRNKVQYRTFDFQVLRTEHFDVYYYPEEAEAVRDAARMAERWYVRLSRLLGHEFEERQPLVLYGSHPAFQQTTTLSGDIGEGTGGVTEGLKQRVIMPLTGSYQETDHVLGHEIVHAFQYDISGLGRSGGSISPAAQAFAQAPLWFVEGMAEYLSVGPIDAHTAMWVRDAALAGEVPTIEQLTTDPRIFPYRWGHAFWAYVGGRWGDGAIGEILRSVGAGNPYDQVFEAIFNLPLEEVGADWAASIRRAYLPLLADRPEAREVAQPLITEAREGGELNLGPVLSPDGRYVAFLSEIDFLDVELWLADATTGEVIRRLRRGSAFDPHFQSLRYINSAGTFSPDGNQFAFSALRGGRDVLLILDVDDGDVVRTVDVEGVPEITSPSWSPDGRTIVFSGISGGVSDLYAYDVESRDVRRLTTDLYANLHPSVSPSGRTVAFVTDQGPRTDLGVLEYGDYGIALLDLVTGETRLVSATAVGSTINPVWTRSGDGLYFISTRDGIPNVYRIDLAQDQLYQLTRLFGGVSGITDISPALTAARGTDRLLFTAYEDNGYNIYALNGADELTGTPVGRMADVATVYPAALPPVPRPREAAFNRVSMLLADPSFGLPGQLEAAEWSVQPYSSSLALDYLGQPQVGYALGGAQGLGGLYGGVSAIFSDMLGYQTLATTVQASGQFDEIGFSTYYINQKYRFNFGGVAQRVPYVSAGRRTFYDEEEELVRDQVIRFRNFDTQAKALASYPFSQAQRFELTTGFRRLSQSVRGLELVGPPIVENGEIVGFEPVAEREFELEELANSWNFFETSAALVYDNALFGGTSPFAGQRYRFEISPTLGDLQFAQALADYRRYFWLRPFTFAVQGLHFGRYGEDAENNFNPLFLGDPSLVRGYYQVYSDCQSADNGCNRSAVDLLFGSRVAVAKAELRLPIPEPGSPGGLGIPLEIFGFADAGVAWNQDDFPAFSRGLQMESSDRGWVSSAGVGARVNVFGFAIFEVDYARPLDSDVGWNWVFALQPGF